MKTKISVYMPVVKAMAAWAKEARASLDLNQYDAAKGCGVVQTFVSQLERGSMKKINRKKWARMQKFYTGKGSKAFGGKTQAAEESNGTPTSKELLKQLESIKAIMGGGPWVSVARAVGIHAKTVAEIRKGAEGSEATRAKVAEAIKKLQTLPEELHAEGHVSSPKIVKRKKTIKAPSASIIDTHTMTAADAILQRIADCSRAEREALTRMLPAAEANPSMLNGKTSSFARS